MADTGYSIRSVDELYSREAHLRGGWQWEVWSWANAGGLAEARFHDRPMAELFVRALELADEGGPIIYGIVGLDEDAVAAEA